MSRLAVGGALLAAAAYGPALASVGPLRRALTPGLSGVGRAPHVALTYDDGPDPVSTPYFLDLLDAHGRTATFFLLGAHVERHPALVAEMAARGHELAVHGWDHVPVVLKRPATLARELRATVAAVERVTGQQPTWYRPPYGVLSAGALHAARTAGLRTVLWTAWGRDWEASATPERIVATVDRRLEPGGTLLLHDTDRTSAPGSWERTLAASTVLLDRWARTDAEVGPLREHHARPLAAVGP
ncbi:MAG: polysaccharide deacetylase family protein [Nocardioides sp.]